LSSIFNKLNKIMTIYIYIVVISNPATIYCNVHIRILSNLAKKSVIIFELPILKNYCTRRQLVFRVQRRGIFFWTQMKVDPPAIAMLRHERAGYRDFEYRENTYPWYPAASPCGLAWRASRRKPVTVRRAGLCPHLTDSTDR
jgi:hypothetical protein